MGGWFLAHQCFQEWESSAGGTLCGCGKNCPCVRPNFACPPFANVTFNRSVVVEHLHRKSEDHNLGVANIYLNHKETQSPAHLLASVWRQLVLGKSIGSAAQRAYDQHSEKGTEPSLDEIDQILRSAVTEWSKVYVVIDALDEYPEEERYILLGYLAVMGPTVNLMLTSRPNISLHNSLTNFQVIEIRANEVDIRRYLDEQIRISPRLSLHVNARPVLRHEIVSCLIARADGMFLLAKLHIESLRKKPTIRALQEALQNLPADLEHTYEDTMERIEAQDGEDSRIARSALTWIANVKRLLTVRELQEALAIEPGTTRMDPENLLDIEIILSVCAGLVLVDMNKQVRLVHYTTQDYLDSIQARRFPDVQTHITRTLLTVLAFDGESRFCLVHAVGQPEADLRDMIANFLGQSSNFSTLRRGSGPPPWNYPDWPAYTSPLWIAAGANLVETATNLINTMPKSLHDTDCSPLHVATFYGHLEMVQLLIEEGADVDARDRRSTSALHIASSRGHEIIVRLLIKHGAEVNAQDAECSTALHVACRKGHTELVRLLIELGADLDAREQNRTPLLIALGDSKPATKTSYGNTAYPDLDINTAYPDLDMYYDDDIRYKETTRRDIVRFLIKNGADVNAQGGYFGNALQAASCKGTPETIQILLDAGAAVSAQGGKYGNALQAASYKGTPETVQILINAGAAVNAQGGEHGNALQAASSLREQMYPEIVQMLLKAGAIIVNTQGESAVAAALWANRLDIVLLLIGNDPDYHWANWSESILYKLIQFLIQNGVDVNAYGGQYGTMLQVASYLGHYKALHFLVELGGNVNVQGGKYGPPLQAAWMGRCKMLADWVPDNEPLAHQLALCENYLAMVQLTKKHRIPMTEDNLQHFVNFLWIHKFLVKQGADVS
ncbi:ankyrin repeat-containing domain protein, partial [Mycena latifolia]